DGRIWVPDVNDLYLRILLINHDNPVSGHFGQNKTLELVRRDYTWPGIRMFVKDYCKSCTTCARSKAPRHWPYGFLRQLPIPEKPWNSISIDFIDQLPSSSGYTSILVIVDRLTKQDFHCNPRHYHVRTTCRALRNPCVFQARSSRSCHVRSRTRVRFPLLQISRKGFKYEAPLHLRISPRRRWAN